MAAFQNKDEKVFALFDRQWALVSAGSPENFNTCTVSWGSMGTLWSRPVITVYLHPARLTKEYLERSETFTVSFFPESKRKALAYLGSHSGRDGDKVKVSGLTPIPVGGSTGFAEAERIFVCRKLYGGPFSKEGLREDIQDLYRRNPDSFPADEQGAWQPHWVFVGEVTEVREEETSK